MSFFISPYDLSSGFDGDFQLLFLFLVYGFILYKGSNYISDGSELLLLIPSMAGIVGSVVLPVLGAVPDGAIVLFSGMGDDAQEQVSVGVGALAGSTVMLITVPWCLSVYAGRVKIDDGIPNYTRPKLKEGLERDIFKNGVTGGPLTIVGGKIMLMTCICYAIIQGPAFVYTGSDSTLAAEESNWALLGFIVSFLGFFGYLAYQYYLAHNDEDERKKMRTVEIMKKKIAKGEVSLLGVVYPLLSKYVRHDRPPTSPAGSYSQLPDAPEDAVASMRLILKPFFDRYDVDKNGTMDIRELAGTMNDLQEKVAPAELQTLFLKFDTDHSGTISFDEFVRGVTSFVINYSPPPYHTPRARRMSSQGGGGGGNNSARSGGSQGRYQTLEDGGSSLIGDGDGDDDDDESEEGTDEDAEEIPEDLADLPPHEQQRRILARSLYMMGFGTALVLAFSDPMVDVLTEVGNRTGISSFYVSFVLAPLASNASELIASYNYAAKKTKRTMAVSLSALEGAACMNNTFCLGIFLGLIYFRDLAWTFSAETVSILVVEIVVAIVAIYQSKCHRVFDALLILLLYPLSLCIVAGLEAAGLD